VKPGTMAIRAKTRYCEHLTKEVVLFFKGIKIPECARILVAPGSLTPVAGNVHMHAASAAYYLGRRYRK